MKFVLCVVLLAAFLGHFAAEAYIARSSASSVGRDLPKEQWYTQRLDHFNGQETRTWKQRYFINDTFWNPSAPGPIFFQMGGEGAVSGEDVVLLQMVQYGIKHGALMVTLEHRFYGTSQPLPDLSIESLRFLSSEQALADAAEFLLWLKDQYQAPKSPIITFGCSYPGALAAWFRLKYPHVTYASVASSAPVEATLDFFEYLDVVDQSLEYFVGDKCVANIKQATTAVSQLMASPGGRAKLQSLFNFCGPIQNELDIANFYSSLAGNWMGTVQYNDENGNPLDVIYLCKIMTQPGVDPLTAYVNISNIFLRSQDQSCLDVSYADAIAQLRDTSAAAAGVGIRQWVYQTCTEFGYFQTSDSDGQPFGDGMPLKFSLDQCRDAFGLIDPPRISATNHIYGGRNLPAWGPSNILFVNGNIDPWHALSITKSISPSLTTVFINGTAHCANVLPAHENDPPSLVQARKDIQAQIDQWLAQAKRQFAY